MSSLCRDCQRIMQVPPPSCPECGSLRIISDEALLTLAIAHVDCDAFYASVEKRDNPGLRGRPVIIGGGSRGVVTTCCYIARLYGVKSAMPMFRAMQLCPDAAVIAPDFSKYRRTASLIRGLMHELTPLVEPVSIDEAYLDLSGTQRLHGCPPAASLARFAARVEQEAGITVSLGLSSNKFLAKTASELDKPRGFAVLSALSAEAFLAPLGLDQLHGVGPALARSLAREGYHKVEDIQREELKTLIRLYGETGERLKRCAHGQDNRPVNPRSGRQSVSAETTLAEDSHDRAFLENCLWKLCVRVSDQLKAEGLAGHIVTLKLKTPDFRVRTRRMQLRAPSQIAQELFRAVRLLLVREAGGIPSCRLIGISLSDLRAHQGDDTDLLDPSIARRAAAERASDRARARFGPGAVVTGRGLNSSAAPRR